MPGGRNPRKKKITPSPQVPASTPTSHQQQPLPSPKSQQPIQQDYSQHFTNLQDQNQDLSLREYWETILRYRITVLIVITISFLASISIYTFQPNTYSATCKLLNKSSDGGASPLALINPGGGGDNFNLKTILRIVKTKEVVEISKRLTPNYFNQIILDKQISSNERKLYNTLNPEIIKSSLTVRTDHEADNIILISSTLNDSPHLTASIANATADAIIEKLKSIKFEESQEKIITFENLIQENQKEMTDLDKKINLLHHQTNGRVSLTSREKRVLSLLARTEQRLQENLLKKKELLQQIETIKRNFKIEHLDLDKVRFIDMASGMQQKLQDLKFQREELLTRYKPKNPSIRKLTNQINSLEETLQPKDDKDVHYVKVDKFRSNLVTTLIDSKNDLESLNKRIKFIKSEIKDLNNKLVEVPAELKNLRKLTAKKEILSNLLGNLHKSLQQEKIIQISSTPKISIMERAFPIYSSTSHGILKFCFIGLALGIALGISLAFILNNWENTLKSSSDLKRHFRYPPLGVIPKWQNEEKYIDELEPDSSLAEVYGVLRNNVRFCKIETPEKCLLVASASQGEGKSLTAANLCVSFALEGNTCLLISADLRRPFTHMRFRKKEDIKKNIGIVEYLENKNTFDEVLYHSNIENFDFIPTCTKAKNPTRLLKTDEFKQLIDIGSSRYDVVIIDSPAILPVVDATIFSSLVRGVLLVAQANVTPISAIQEAISRLEHVGSPIIGIALNSIKDLKLEFFYGYGISQYTHYKPES